MLASSFFFLPPKTDEFFGSIIGDSSWYKRGPKVSEVSTSQMKEPGPQCAKIQGQKLPNWPQGSLAAIFCAPAFRTSGEGLCSLTAIRRKWERFLWTQIVPSKSFRSGMICR